MVLCVLVFLGLRLGTMESENYVRNFRVCLRSIHFSLRKAVRHCSSNKASLRDFPRILSWRGDSNAFVRDFLQKVKVEDVRTKGSCETSRAARAWKSDTPLL